MKINRIPLLFLLTCSIVVNGWSQKSELLTFGVISDTHFENGIGEGAMMKVPRALKNLTSQARLDALVIVGDLTDKGRADQYEMLVKVFTDKANYIYPVEHLFFMMGNHDHVDRNGVSNYQDGLKSFNGGDPYPLHQYKIIKGYPFITISMLTCNSDAYSDDLRKQLDSQMAQAARECPGKPIFVFTHVPPQWTVYGSWPEFEGGSSWALPDLNPVLNKYPQAVVFAGHSHYPLGDQRSIHQGANPNSVCQNYYTVINVGSTTYSEVHPGVVSTGIHPEKYAYVTEGVVVSELENGDIEIRCYDTYRNAEICTGRWVLKSPFDGSNFEYADIRDKDDNPNKVHLRDGLPAPVFADFAEISVETSDTCAVITFPQAVDYECVFRYRIRVFKDGLVVSENFIFSQFYLYNDMPPTISSTICGLTPNMDYFVEVVAYDSYDNISAPISTIFKTVQTLY